MKPNDPNPSKLKLMAQDEEAFAEIVSLIAASRQRALQAVNSTLIDLYWQAGETISRKIEAAEWGDGVVPQLAAYIARTQPGIRGFTRANLFRMRQFYETYRDDSIVVALLRQLPWTHHLIIFGQSKRPEEREFYIRMALQERGQAASWNVSSRLLSSSALCSSRQKSQHRCDKWSPRRWASSKTPTCWSSWTCRLDTLKPIYIEHWCTSSKIF